MPNYLEDYDRNHPFVDLLSVSIDCWEDEPEELSGFNEAVAALMPIVVAALRVHMNQNHMTIADQYRTDGDNQFAQAYLRLLDKNIQEMSENLRPLSQEL